MWKSEISCVLRYVCVPRVPHGISTLDDVPHMCIHNFHQILISENSTIQCNLERIGSIFPLYLFWHKYKSYLKNSFSVLEKAKSQKSCAKLNKNHAEGTNSASMEGTINTEEALTGPVLY